MSFVLGRFIFLIEIELYNFLWKFLFEIVVFLIQIREILVDKFLRIILLYMYYVKYCRKQMYVENKCQIFMISLVNMEWVKMIVDVGMLFYQLRIYY